MYEYRATVRYVYDADTVRMDVDLGFGTWLHNQSMRLYGINAPEVRGPEKPEGIKSRDALRNMIPPGLPVIVQTFKDKKGKYGRWLAEIFVVTDDDDKIMSVNKWLVENGHAKEADY